MAEVKLRALVLREVDFGDWDRYLTVLAEDGRRVEILCKNARRGKKTNPAARQLCFSEFILAERGEKYALREADLVHSFFGLAEDIERYALACYLCELTSALSDPGLESPALCRLLLTALLALERKKRDPALVKAAFELRVMAESGYAPDLQACSICGEAVMAGPVWFSVPAGGIAHESCARRVGGCMPLDGSALRAVVHVLSAEPKRLAAFALTGAAAGQLAALAEQYVRFHLGRGFSSLDFYRSLAGPAGGAGVHRREQKGT